MKGFTPKDLIGIVLQPIEKVADTLERKLGLFSVVIISLSAMLGSGLFVLPALAMLEMGGGTNPVGGIWLAYLFAALIVLPGALSKSELATAMPSSGGSYVYVERTFGPLIGTISGLGLWANFMLKSAFALIGFKAYLWVLEGLFNVEIDNYVDRIALVLLFLITIINILGLKKIKKVQIPIVLTSVIFLFMLCIWAIFTMDLKWESVFAREAFGSGLESIAGTAAFVFVAYAWVTKIAAVGGEIKNPGKNMPYGILLSLLISCLLYVIISIVMVATIEPSKFMESGMPREDPIYIFANAVGGKYIGLVASFLAVITMTSMALAGIMASSRFPFAMARDNLLPEAIENVHPKYDTPHLSIIITGLAMAATLTFLPVKDIAKLASGFKIMIFIVINCCVIVLRTASKSHSWYNPKWKSPMFPYIQIFGIIVSSWMLILMGEKALIGALVAIIIGVILYKSYGEKYNKPEITPWETFRLMLKNPDEAEKRRFYAAFHAADTKRNNHLNLQEFISAMEALELNDDGHDALREYFHIADKNNDGVVDIDEFLEHLEQIEP